MKRKMIAAIANYAKHRRHPPRFAASETCRRAMEKAGNTVAACVKRRPPLLRMLARPADDLCIDFSFE